MSDASPPTRRFDLPKITLGVMVVFTVSGLILDGLPDWRTIDRIWGNLGERVGGPLHFRLYLQPAMATVAAILDGYRDAKAGRSAYLATLVTDKSRRAAGLSESLNATARILLLGLVMDMIFQILEHQGIYPFEAVLVAIILCWLPYVILRGPARRLAGWLMTRAAAPERK